MSDVRNRCHPVSLISVSYRPLSSPHSPTVGRVPCCPGQHHGLQTHLRSDPTPREQILIHPNCSRRPPIRRHTCFSQTPTVSSSKLRRSLYAADLSCTAAVPTTLAGTRARSRTSTKFVKTSNTSTHHSLRTDDVSIGLHSESGLSSHLLGTTRHQLHR